MCVIDNFPFFLLVDHDFDTCTFSLFSGKEAGSEPWED